MIETTPSQLRRLHAPFLERATRERGDPSSQVALAAFLTVRALDQLGDPAAKPAAIDHQIQALGRFLKDLPAAPGSPEVQWLNEVCQACRASSHGDHSALWPAVSGYAGWLEGEFRMAEAIDVVDTMVAVATERCQRSIPAVHLQRGRILRRSGEFDQATQAYTNAGRFAAEQGETHTELLSRIGRGIVLQHRGNLPAAGDLLRQVCRDARAIGDRDAEARATHDLAVNHIKQQDPATAATLAYRAFGLYESSQSRYRAMADLGTALSALGHYSAARDAHEFVVAGDVPRGMRATALIELLGLSSAMGDRMSFERTRRTLGEMQSALPPDWLIDYTLKLGVGLVQFSKEAEGTSTIRRAIELAEQHGFNELLFAAEAALQDVLDQQAPPSAPVATDTDWEASYPDVAEIATELHHLRVGV